MKLILNIGDKDVLLTYEQLEVITNILAESDMVVREYMGAALSEADRYKQLVRPVDMALLSVKCMDDTRYAALTLITKLHDENAQKK